MTDAGSFLQRLASSSPVPGGGSVAALDTAMAAALLVMVSNLTIGKAKYASVADQVSTIKAAAQECMDRAESLIREDADAFEAVSVAMRMPRESEGEKERRATALQAALKEAAEPPRRTMDTAERVLRLANDLVSIGNASAVSDVATAALCASSGYLAARLNVDINLAAVTDDAWKEGMRREISAFQPRDLADQVVRRAEDIISRKVV